MPNFSELESIKFFLNSVMRAEYYENPRAYKKAIRATLIALGYDSKIIDGLFHDFMEYYYKVYYDEV